MVPSPASHQHPGLLPSSELRALVHSFSPCLFRVFISILLHKGRRRGLCRTGISRSSARHPSRPLAHLRCHACCHVPERAGLCEAICLLCIPCLPSWEPLPILLLAYTGIQSNGTLVLFNGPNRDDRGTSVFLIVLGESDRYICEYFD